MQEPAPYHHFDCFLRGDSFNVDKYLQFDHAPQRSLSATNLDMHQSSGSKASRNGTNSSLDTSSLGQSIIHHHRNRPQLNCRASLLPHNRYEGVLIFSLNPKVPQVIHLCKRARRRHSGMNFHVAFEIRWSNRRRRVLYQVEHTTERYGPVVTNHTPESFIFLFGNPGLVLSSPYGNFDSSTWSA